MKTLTKILLLATLIINPSALTIAQNLVPNPSFEDTISCPKTAGDTYSLDSWEININTADYFNFCCKNPFQVAVPKNAWGYQCPANGSAYAGVYAYSQPNPGSNEFIGCHLLSPLTIGQKYYVSFKVSLADDNANLMCGINNMGILFTNINYSSITLIPAPVLQNYAQITSSSIIMDTTNWVTISGSFIADSAYQYLLIGHFYDNSHTIVNCLDSNNISNRWSYYFIDDVCVSTDSLTCIIPNSQNICDTTGNILETNQKDKITVLPNPTSNKIWIDLPYSTKTNIKIYNSLGSLLYNEKFLEKRITIDFSFLPDGIYLINVRYNDKLFMNKILLIK